MKKSIVIILSIILIIAFILPASAFSSIAIKGIKLDKSKITLNIGQTYKLKITLTPANSTQKKLTYVTGNKNIATIDTTGKIKGISKGTTTITVYTLNKKISAKCNVTVTKLDKPLTWWSMLNGTYSRNYSNGGDSEFAKELERRTGIKVIYQDPAGDWDKFNLMMASNDLPDIILYWWKSYPGGGITKALEEKKIIPINDYMDEYAPNLKKYFKENPDVARMAKTNEGLVPGFPSVDVGLTALGPAVRKDWLDELGLTVPKTVDEWYNMLKAFKEKKGVKAPFTYRNTFFSEKVFSSIFTSANQDGFYIKDGKVMFAPLQPEFKEYIKLIKKWYDEGLIDKDISVIDTNIWAAKMSNGDAGATILSTSRLDSFEQAGKPIAPKYDLVPVEWPTLKKGKKNEYTGGEFKYNSTDYVSAITSSCKNPQLACRLLDYLYSEEGHMLAVFGIKGVTYEIDNNGKIKNIGEVANPPEGKSIFDMRAKYCLSYGSGTYVDDIRRWDLDFNEQQKLALNIWNNADRVLPNKLPPMRLNEAESEKVSNSELYTYINEMLAKFNYGDIDLEKGYEEFLAQLKKFGVEEIIKVYQSAYDRFLKK